MLDEGHLQRVASDSIVTIVREMEKGTFVNWIEGHSSLIPTCLSTFRITLVDFEGRPDEVYANKCSRRRYPRIRAIEYAFFPAIYCYEVGLHDEAGLFVIVHDNMLAEAEK